jgi:hypothetical protein
LPSALTNLQSRNNQISCLPVLPNSLVSLLAIGNSIVCLPNLPTASGFVSDIGPTVCNNSNDTHGCIAGIFNYPVKEEVLNLFPNPSKGNVSISSDEAVEKVKLIVLSPDGRIVYEREGMDFSDVINIDLSAEAKGIYFIQVLAGNKISVRKLILY